MSYNLPTPAVIFLICISAILIIMVLFLLYVKQVGCCKMIPTPWCLAERPKAIHMDDSDEEIYDKFEDLINMCPEKTESPIVVESIEAEIATLYKSFPGSQDRVDSAVDKVPKVQIGLTYDLTQGQLKVHVIKGNYLRITDNKMDCYVKMSLCSDNGYQISHVDTKRVSNELHPTFDEFHDFDVPNFQVNYVTVMIAAYNKVSLRNKEMVGWIAIGSYNSGDEQLSHWKEAVLSKCNTEIIKWHTLHVAEFLKSDY